MINAHPAILRICLQQMDTDNARCSKHRNRREGISCALAQYILVRLTVSLIFTLISYENLPPYTHNEHHKHIYEPFISLILVIWVLRGHLSCSYITASSALDSSVS